MAQTPDEFSIGIEIFAKLETLEKSLKEAEKKIETSAKRMAEKAKRAAEQAASQAEFEGVRAALQREADLLTGGPESFYDPDTIKAEGGKVGDTLANAAAPQFARQFRRKMSKLVGVGMAAAVGDLLLESIRTGLEEGKGFYDLGGHAVKHFAEGFTDMVGSIPIFGEIMKIGGELFDAMGAFGGPMGMERQQQKSREIAKERLAADHARLRRLDKERRAMEEIARLEQEVVNARLLIEQRDRDRRLRAMDKSFGRSMRTAQSGTEFKTIEDVDRVSDRLRETANYNFETAQRIINEEANARMKAVMDSEDLHAKQKQAQMLLLRDERDEKLRMLKEEFDERHEQIYAFAEEEREQVRQRLEEEARFHEEVLRQKQLGEARLAQAQMQAEELRQAAHMRTQQMTRTVGTAGGSFTYAVRAQVDETKMMREIVQKIPELMMVLINSVQSRGVTLA